ncbi:MAG: SMP-30/gluconolactonase/LRE family protein [Aliiglaciecola sp.]
MKKLVLNFALIVFYSSMCCAEVVFLDERAKTYIAEDAKLKTLGSGFKWTEGPLWVPQMRILLFSDIPNNTIFQYTENGDIKPYLAPSGATQLASGDSMQGSNGLLIDPSGNLLLLQQGDRRVATMQTDISRPSTSFKTLVSHFEGKRLNSPNDGVFDSSGNLYFTDPPYGMNGIMDAPNKALPFQGVYMLKPDGELTLIDKSLSFPNGIALSPEDKTLYVAVSDPEAATWYAYNQDTKTGQWHRQVFFDATSYVGKANYQGYPDGMVVHSSGVIFASGPGGIWLFDNKGTPLAKIFTSKLTANCTLSADESTLFITAHDTLMSLPLITN